MRKHFLSLLLCFVISGLHAQQRDIFDAARKGSVKEAQSLFARDASSIDSRNADGYTPLILATYHSNNEVAEFLVSKGADVDAVSGMGTALMAAVVKNNAEMVRVLLEKGANPNLTDANGSTALLYAVMFKKPELAKALMNAGANPEQKDKRGQNAIDYAILVNDDQLIEILKTRKL